jgi:hypothetical protein
MLKVVDIFKNLHALCINFGVGAAFFYFNTVEFSREVPMERRVIQPYLSQTRRETVDYYWWCMLDPVTELILN